MTTFMILKNKVTLSSLNKVCLNGSVIKWQDKINHLDIVNVNLNDDDCHSKRCGFNGAVNKLISN